MLLRLICDIPAMSKYSAEMRRQEKEQAELERNPRDNDSVAFSRAVFVGGCCVLAPFTAGASLGVLVGWLVYKALTTLK